LKVSCEQKTLYRSNKVLGYILRCNENVRKDIFCESKLKSLSPTHFNTLLSNQLLVETYQDPEQITHYDENGTAYRVRKEENDYIGYRLKGDGDAKIKLTKSDVTFFKFKFEAFCQLIKNKNSFAGKYIAPTQRIHFIGRTEKDKNIICSCIAFFDSDRTAKQELLALSSNFSQYQYFVVLSPNFELNEELNGRLYDKGIFYRTFGLGCDNNWKIDLSVIKLKKDQGSKFVTPELTQKQEADYKEYGYKCYDTIYLPGTCKQKGSNDVVVNDHKVTMADEAFIWFIQFVAELKKKEGGWFKTGVDAGRHQPFGRVRDPIKGSLLKKNGTDFIQNRGGGEYRISTHPDFVRYERSALMNHGNSTIKSLARKLPIIRKKKA
jgi:hypothetical protein